LFSITFDKCPICKSKGTVGELALKDENLPEGTFISLEKVVTPVHDVGRITTPMIKCLVIHYDICAKCGMRYCTRVEMINAPVSYKGGMPQTS